MTSPKYASRISLFGVLLLFSLPTLAFNPSHLKIPKVFTTAFQALIKLYSLTVEQMLTDESYQNKRIQFIKI